MAPVAPDCPLIDVTVEDVTILGEVEIRNDVGNPVPVEVQGCVELCPGTSVSVDNFPASVEVENEVGSALPVTGTVAITETSPAFTHGQNTDVDSGAAEQVVVASNPALHGVLVKTPSSNTGIVYVGTVGVTTLTGFPLEGGDTVTIPVDDANKVYVIASDDDQTVAWIAA